MPLLKYTKEDRKRAMKLYAAGMNSRQVSGVTGVHRYTVLKWAREDGIVRDRSTISLSDKEKKEVREYYITYRHSSREVSLITGISIHKIKYYLRKEGLSRTSGEARKLKHQKKLQRKQTS